MTLQRYDFLFVDGVRRRIAAAAPVPFTPNAFDLRFGGTLGTHCDRGFWVDFSIEGSVFTIKELRLTTHPNDRKEVLHGRLFDREPDEVTEYSVAFRDIPLAYTGRLIVDRISTESLSQMHKKEIFCFVDGGLRLREKVELRELPEEYTPSSVWVDYGVMLWVLPESFDSEAT